VNFSLVTVVVFGVGAILTYAAVKNQNPADVVRMALGQPSTGNNGRFDPPKGGGGGGEFKPTHGGRVAGPITPVTSV